MASGQGARTPAEPALGRGRSTRYKIIERTARLCSERHGAELSVAEIAAAAGVFPNQVTYYFGSKDSLLVHAAFLGLLQDAKGIESVGLASPDAAAFREDIARAVLALPSLPTVARALAAGISRPALAPVVDKHLDLLFRQSEHYLRRVMRERGWRLDRAPGCEARTFWSAALGAALLARAGASGATAGLDLAGTLTIRDAAWPLSLAGPSRHTGDQDVRRQPGGPDQEAQPDNDGAAQHRPRAADRPGRAHPADAGQGSASPS